MLNQVVLVGRLVNDVKIEELEEGKKVASITLAIPRSYKNENGEYDTDFITCDILGSIAENVSEYCKKGDLIGVKARMESKDGKQQIVVEKVTFLSSKKADE